MKKDPTLSFHKILFSPNIFRKDLMHIFLVFKFENKK